MSRLLPVDQAVAAYNTLLRGDSNPLGVLSGHENADGLSPDVAERLRLPIDVEREARLDYDVAVEIAEREARGEHVEPYRGEATIEGARAAPSRRNYRIITRRESGLPPSRATVDRQRKTEGFVHYTADNGRQIWNQSTAGARLRSYYRYHTQSQGWSDLGYHFIVFPGWFSRPTFIFEGRPVTRIPAAQYRHNSGTIAVCVVADANDYAMIGTVDAVAWLFWRFQHLRTVGGHRQVVSTSCPGNRWYARVPEIARRAECTIYRR